MISSTAFLAPLNAYHITNILNSGVTATLVALLDVRHSFKPKMVKCDSRFKQRSMSRNYPALRRKRHKNTSKVQADWSVCTQTELRIVSQPTSTPGLDRFNNYVYESSAGTLYSSISSKAIILTLRTRSRRSHLPRRDRHRYRQPGLPRQKH